MYDFGEANSLFMEIGFTLVMHLVYEHLVDSTI